MNLLLPKDGSIVIIDDQYTEAKPLLDLLSTNGHPSIYFTGSLNDLPALGIYLERVRIVFADIQLVPALSAQTYTQMLIEHLNRLISDRNGPYILLIWSRMENLYADNLKEMIDAPAFAKKPIAFIKLNKAEYFRTINTSIIDSEQFQNILRTRFQQNDIDVINAAIDDQFPATERKEIVNNAITKINRKIKEKIKNYKAFELLISWEEMIQKTATNFMSDISSVHTINEFWDYNFRNVISRFAESQVSQHIKNLTKKEFVNAAIKTMNIAFSDSVDKSIPENLNISNNDFFDYKNTGYEIKIDEHKYKILWNDFQHFELYIDDQKKGDNKKTITDLIKIVNNNLAQKAIITEMIESYLGINPNLNSKLHLDLITKNPFQPGIVYLIKGVPNGRKRRFLSETYFKNSPFLNKNADGEYLINNIDLEKIKFIELEVSPNCDYAQNKWLKHRIISGIMIHKKLLQDLHIKEDESLYKELPLVKFQSEIYKIIFSFKLLKSIDLAEAQIRVSKVLFRIKNEPMADIITRMVSHASRLGLVEIK